MEEGRSTDVYRSPERYLAIDPRMWEIWKMQYGKVCYECALENSSKLNISRCHIIDN